MRNLNRVLIVDPKMYHDLMMDLGSKGYHWYHGDLPTEWTPSAFSPDTYLTLGYSLFITIYQGGYIKYHWEILPPNMHK